MSCAAIILGGEPISGRAAAEIPVGAFVIAVDSGLDHALSLGLRVDLLVGDLDSVSPASLEKTPTLPRQIYPTDKDATDFELALGVAVAAPDTDHLLVLGGHGGRLDHLLGNLAVLSNPALGGYRVTWIAGTTRVEVIADKMTIHGEVGDTVSLLALTDEVTGVTTHGLEWPLADTTMHRWSSRTISNRLSLPTATIAVRSGVLASLQPAD